VRILEPESEIMTKKKKKRRKLWCLKRLCLRERTFINIYKHFKIFINILKCVRTAVVVEMGNEHPPFRRRPYSAFSLEIVVDFIFLYAKVFRRSTALQSRLPN